MMDVFFVACCIAGLFGGVFGPDLPPFKAFLGGLKGPRRRISVAGNVGMLGGMLVAVLLEFLWNKVTSGAFCGGIDVATAFCSSFSHAFGEMIPHAFGEMFP